MVSTTPLTSASLDGAPSGGGGGGGGGGSGRPSVPPSATIVQVPPLPRPKPPPSTGGVPSTTQQQERQPADGVNTTTTTTSTIPPKSSLPSLLDPYALLDSYDRARNANHLRTLRQQQQQQQQTDGPAPPTSKLQQQPAQPQPPTLDPVQFLNQHYQTEAALTQQLDSLREAVTGRMQSLEDRISMAIQRQSESAASSRDSVQAAKAAVQTLVERIALVRDKAAQSEHAVLHITSDMKLLDTSKRHLQRTITTLKRLHMLVHAVEELRLLAQAEPSPPDRFHTASQLVQAIRILSRHFDIYQAKVPPLQKLGRTVTLLQNKLLQQVVQGFRWAAVGVEQAQRLDKLQLEQKQQNGQKGKIADTAAGTIVALNTGTGEDSLSSSLVEGDNAASSSLASIQDCTPDVLRGGVLYLDALGLETRQQFIRNFCHDLLRPYMDDFTPVTQPTEPTTKPNVPDKRVSSFKVQKVPEPSEEDAAAAAAAEAKKKACSLDAVEQRFLWFRQVLADEMHPQFQSIFPSEWHVQTHLARAFLRLTHEHFVLLLTKGPRAEANNATILLKALQKTLVFEKEITGWLVRECQVEFAHSPTAAAAAPGPASKSSDGDDYDNDDGFVTSSSPRKEKTVTLEPLMGAASVAFDNYMSPYITLEAQSMNDELAKALEDQTVDNRGELPVFISSTNLFVYIKGSITRCTALTKGKPFYQLYQTFSNSLRKYSSILDGKLPKPVSQNALTSSSMAAITIAGLGKSTSVGASSGSGGGGGGTNALEGGSNAESYKIPPGEEVIICHVISTCEYCAETVEALEELIVDTMDDKLPYKAKINMSIDQEAFHDLTAKSIRVLVSGLMNRTQDVAIKQLLATNWGQWESVGEESEYVRIIHQDVGPFCITTKSLLPLTYFRSFCDKFATLFGALFYDAVIRLKRISEPGTQQLLLDVYNLKTLFLKLPVLEELSSSSTTTSSGKKPGSSIAPAMYTKLVQKQFGKIETLLKLVGTPVDMLIENFKSVVAGGGTAAELQIVMNLKGMKRPEQVAYLEKFGLDPVKALKGATRGVSSASLVTERVQAVTSDLNQMRQKVDDFRKSFR